MSNPSKPTSPWPLPPAPQSKKLLDQYSEALRNRYYSLRTEKIYISWIRQHILFHNKRPPRDMGVPEINDFITHLVNQKTVSASTQNQAISAILFLYREVIHQEEEPILLSSARRPERLPTVLTHDETLRVIDCLAGIQKLMAQLLYGSGLRLMECVRLRVKDIDFDYKTIAVRDGKGEKDRIVPLPDSVVSSLQRQIERVRLLYAEDLAAGLGEVYLPAALDRKYPNAVRELVWQYLFPAFKRTIDPRSGKERRHHIDSSSLQRAVDDRQAQSFPLAPHVNDRPSTADHPPISSLQSLISTYQ